MFARRYSLFILAFAGSLMVSGCEDSRTAPPPDQQALTRPAAEPGAASSAKSATKPDKVKSAPEHSEAQVVSAPQARKPLNLTLPPQPKVEMGAFEANSPTSENLLPDLFEHQQEKSPYSLRGRVFMDQTGEETIDSIDGGQVTVEMKTR